MRDGFVEIQQLTHEGEQAVLKYENQPRRFSYLFEKSATPAICVAIWEPCVDRLSELFGMHRGVPDYIQQWKFGAFESNLRSGFGFEGAMSVAGVEEGYLVLRAPLLRKQNATAVSLGILFSVLNFYPFFSQDHYKEEAPADSSRLQLMELESSVLSDEDWHSAPLGGTAAPVLVEWVDGIYKERPRLEAAEEAMWLAWNAMSAFPEKKRNKAPTPYLGFNTRLGEKGSFFFGCIGNACDVSTMDWWDRRPGGGHDLGCHNLDTPIQQLSLIAGLATLHEIADKEINFWPPA